MVLVKGDGGYLHTVVKDVCVCHYRKIGII